MASGQSTGSASLSAPRKIRDCCASCHLGLRDVGRDLQLALLDLAPAADQWLAERKGDPAARAVHDRRVEGNAGGLPETGRREARALDGGLVRRDAGPGVQHDSRPPQRVRLRTPRLPRVAGGAGGRELGVVAQRRTPDVDEVDRLCAR